MNHQLQIFYSPLGLAHKVLFFPFESFMTHSYYYAVYTATHFYFIIQVNTQLDCF